MRAMSAAFRRAIFDGRADYTNYLEFTFADSSTLTIGNESIMQDGCKMEDAVSAEGVFQVGAVIIGSATFELNNFNDSLTAYPFEGAQVVWYVGMNDLDDNTNATVGNGAVKMGTFYVDETEFDGHIITLRCLDNLGKLDVPFDWSSFGPSYTLKSIVSAVSTQTGLTFANLLLLPHASYDVAAPADSVNNATCRQVISWVAQVAGCFVRADANGDLWFSWFDTSAFTPSAGTSLYGGYFDETEQSTYQSGDDADGGSFDPWNTGDVTDGGNFTSYQNIDLIQSCFSQKLSMADIEITGVRVTYKTGDGGTSASIAEETTGTAGYMISIEDNPFINTIMDAHYSRNTVQDILGFIGSAVVGMKFRVGEIVHPSDPAIEAGDVGYYWDTYGNQHGILISSTEFKGSVTQRTSSSAASVENNASVRYSNSTRNYAETLSAVNGAYIRDQLNEAEIWKTDTLDTSAVNASFTNTGQFLSAKIVKSNGVVTLTGSLATGSNVAANADIQMFSLPSNYRPSTRVYLHMFTDVGTTEVTVYVDDSSDAVRLLSTNVTPSTSYRFTVSYAI